MNFDYHHWMLQIDQYPDYLYFQFVFLKYNFHVLIDKILPHIVHSILDLQLNDLLMFHFPEKFKFLIIDFIFNILFRDYRPVVLINDFHFLISKKKQTNPT